VDVYAIWVDEHGVWWLAEDKTVGLLGSVPEADNFFLMP